MSVLHQVKGRLAPDWEMKRIIDWGSGTGSGLWFVDWVVITFLD